MTNLWVGCYAKAMIRIQLGRLLGERQMKMLDLSRKTGIDKNALSNLYHQKVGGIRFDTLDKICHALNCGVGDLLEYVEEQTL